jgi:ankyrin repeat protein
MIDAQNHRGSTPLHWAANIGRIGVVRLLLEHGADVNLRDGNGNTPSQLASESVH